MRKGVSITAMTGAAEPTIVGSPTWKKANKGNSLRFFPFTKGRKMRDYAGVPAELEIETPYALAGDCPDFRGGEDLLLGDARVRRENAIVPFGQARNMRRNQVFCRAMVRGLVAAALALLAAAARG